MKSYNLGYMTQADAKKVLENLDGKTYMEFRVSIGQAGGGDWDVQISTYYDATDVEILTFALHALATV